jgi:hypothetical protein
MGMLTRRASGSLLASGMRKVMPARYHGLIEMVRTSRASLSQDPRLPQCWMSPGNLWVANNWDSVEAATAANPFRPTSTQGGGSGFTIIYGIAASCENSAPRHGAQAVNPTIADEARRSSPMRRPANSPSVVEVFLTGIAVGYSSRLRRTASGRFDSFTQGHRNGRKSRCPKIRSRRTSFTSPRNKTA